MAELLSVKCFYIIMNRWSDVHIALGERCKIVGNKNCNLGVPIMAHW